MYQYYADSFSKLSESTFYKGIVSFTKRNKLKKIRILELKFAPKIDNTADVMLYCIFG